MSNRHIIAEGTYGDELSWLIWAERHEHPSGEPHAGELMHMIRITNADGRVLYEGGGGGPALWPGLLMNVSTGGSDDSPYTLLALVHPSIRQVRLHTADGQSIDAPVYDCPAIPEVRFAALLLPPDERLDSVTGHNGQGQELEQFDLTAHQRFWYQHR